MKVLASLTAIAIATSTVLADLTGDKICPSGQDWCIAATYDGATAVSYNLTVNQGGKQIGWRGIGMGSKMAGANMMVGWVNADNSLTLSQRSATGDNQATTAKVTAPAFSTGSSFTDATLTSFAWTFPYEATGSVTALKHIWAINPTAPTTNDPSSTLQKHRSYGFFTLDLTKPLSTNGTITASSTPVASSSNEGDEGKPNRDTSLPSVKVLLAHMVFMIVGWALLVPSGALVARYGRTFFNWKPVHRGIQYTSYLFVFIGFFLAVAWVSKYDVGDHFSSRHEQLGLALFLLLSLQVVMGEVGSRLFRAKGIRIINFGHIVSGIVIFGLAIWNIHLGFEMWDWQPPMYASYIIYGWTAFVFLLYVGGFALIPRERRLSKNPPKSLASDDQEMESAA